MTGFDGETYLRLTGEQRQSSSWNPAMNTSASRSSWCQACAPGCPTATCLTSSTSPGGRLTTSVTATSASRAAGTPAVAEARAPSGSGRPWTPGPAASTSCPPPQPRVLSSACRCHGLSGSGQQRRRPLAREEPGHPARQLRASRSRHVGGRAGVLPPEPAEECSRQLKPVRAAPHGAAPGASRAVPVPGAT
jgi:hypothetical protein